MMILHVEMLAKLHEKRHHASGNHKGMDMATAKRSNGTAEPPVAYGMAVPGMNGVMVVTVGRESKLELRHMLGLAREAFGRLVDVSVRTLAAVETQGIRVEKLQRNYLEVKRLCDALGEVMDPAALGPWLNRPNEAFGGLKPLEVVERGEIDRLWELVFRLRSGLPS
jgi:DNA-binding XRE family transcriptional regulator